MSGFGKKQKKAAVKSSTIHQLAGKELAKEGENHQKHGDLKRAESLYRQAIKIGFQNQVINERLGNLCMHSGREREALQWYQNALKINPNHQNNYIIYAKSAEIYISIGAYDQALTSILKALELKPDNPIVLLILGNVYTNLGNLDQALASILKSLKLKTDNPDALINLGSIYKKLGNLDQALASTLESLKLKPDNPDAFRNLSSIYKDLGNHRQSFASALRSVELKPENPDIIMNLCLVHGEEDLEKIKKVALNVINKSPNCLNSLSFIDAISSLGEDFMRSALAINDISSRCTLD